MNKFKVRFVRTKMLLMVLPLVAVAVVVLTCLAVANSTSVVRKQAYASMAGRAQAGANGFDATQQHYATLADEIATMVQGYQGTRSGLVSMLRADALAHREILGDYITFQPDAFDPPDSDYRNIDGSDPDGHFDPYWNRLGGRFNLEMGLPPTTTAPTTTRCPSTRRGPPSSSRTCTRAR